MTKINYFLRGEKNMRKNKLLACMVACAVTISPMITTPNMPICAEATELTASEIKEGLLTTVSSSYELQQKIDNDLLPTCHEIISPSNPSSLYKLTVPEDGLLVLKLFNNYTNKGTGHYQYVHLYSNASLTNEILSFHATTKSRGVHVKAGTYYFNCTTGLDDTDNTVTVYAGLVPDFIEAKESTVTTISTVDDLLAKIDAGLETSFTDVSVSKFEPTSLYKLTVPEDGWLVLNYNCDTSSSVNVYSNETLTSKILELDRDDKTGSVYVQAGTYYYQASHIGDSENVLHHVYAGWIPSSSKLAVESITLSKDKASAVVKYSTPLDYNTLRTVKGDIFYSNYDNNDIWDATNTTNCAVQNQFTVTSNGTYSARICPTEANEQFAYIIKFNVSGIKSGKPATPTIKTYKRGTSVVKGTAPAYTKVYVKIGKKTYKGSVSAKGTYSVKTKKLKKKTKISVYVKNSASTVSKTKTVTVK